MKVDPVEDVFFVALVVNDGKLGRVEKPAAIQSAGGDEVSPLLSAVAEVDAEIGGAKTAVGSCNAALGRGHALAGARGDVDHYAGLLAEFRWRRAGNHFHRLNRIEGNLVGEDFALLVGDRLAIDRERVLRVVAQSMEEAV